MLARKTENQTPFFSFLSCCFWHKKPLSKTSSAAPENKPELKAPEQQEEKRVSYEIDAHSLIAEEKVLGAGSYSTVVSGTWNGMPVAIKKMDWITEEEKVSCELEKNMLQKITELKISNVVKFYGYSIAPPYYRIVTELAKDGSLGHYLQNPSVPRLKWGQRLKIMCDITKSLESLHAYQIIHRDVKPYNVLLHIENETVHAKLCDFNLAKTVDSVVDDEPVGAFYYMAPEIIRGGTPATEKADIFSLALTLFSVAAGRLPFPSFKLGTNILLFNIAWKGFRETIPSDCPEKIAKLITWCWQADPKDRPTAKEVLSELELDQMSERLAGLKFST